jgi:hypothetical protein
MGGTLQLVTQFPNRPPMVIDHIGGGVSRQKPGGKIKRSARGSKAVSV